MEAMNIHIDEFREYVYNAIIDDEQIVEYYDRSANVKSSAEAVDNIVDKIKTSYPDALIYGINMNGEKVGYYVYKDNLLISFGISTKYRTKETLYIFWEEIKGRIGNNFHSMLYSHNIRAIEWLQKSGMKILFDHITILSYN